MLIVQTLNWNGASKLEKLMHGLYNNLNNINFVWNIKDNGSKDNSIETIKSWKKDNINIYEIGHNRDNFAKGMNYLTNLAKPNKDDYILLLNNDVEFGDNDSLKNMMNLMEKTDAGGVGARLLYPKNNCLQHAGVIFGKRYGEMPYHFRHKEKSDKNAEKNRYFQAVTAAVCLVKAESFLKVGGFCEALNWAFDDIDLNLSIGKRGEKIVYCGNTNIYHEESASLNKNPVNKMFLQKNVQYFREKWAGKYELDHEKYLNDQNYNLIF